eukprot:2419184-Prymnesium_polylepis.1
MPSGEEPATAHRPRSSRAPPSRIPPAPARSLSPQAAGGSREIGREGPSVDARRERPLLRLAHKGSVNHSRESADSRCSAASRAHAAAPSDAATAASWAV